METLTRPDTKWQIVDITNVTFYVTKLKDMALGAPIDLPDNVKFNSGLVNFSTEDHLCFFRCLAVSREGLFYFTRARFHVTVKVIVSIKQNVALGALENVTIFFIVRNKT